MMAALAQAQDPPGWNRSDSNIGGPATVESSRGPDGYRAPSGDSYPPSGANRADTYGRPTERPRYNDAYVPPQPPSERYTADANGGYRPDSSGGYPPPPQHDRDQGGYGQPYTPQPGPGAGPDYDRGPAGPPPGPYAGNDPGYSRWDDRGSQGTYSKNEVVDAGHRFFGSISQGLASAVEWAFQQGGRPNGYVLGEDAGGAFIAGLRYGEGRLFTKDAGTRRVYWQGPSLGYDFGGEGSKTMVLVYNMRDPADIYGRFGGVQGAAYLVGGVSVQFQRRDNVSLAVIRSGVGLRLGANVGYLKYTRSPTWNPF
jgi:hypothetical protein